MSRSFRRQSPGLKKRPCLSDSSLSNRTYNHEKYIYIYIYNNRSFPWPLFPCEAIAMKMKFNSHANETHYHLKSFALSPRFEVEGF